MHRALVGARKSVKMGRTVAKLTVVIGAAFLGPPGLGGDSFGLSMALDSQSFFTGGGKAEPTVAIDTSPEMSRIAR